MLLRSMQSSCCKNCLKPNALGHLLLMIFRFVDRLSMPLGPLDRPTAATHGHLAMGHSAYGTGQMRLQYCHQTLIDSDLMALFCLPE